ncbi:MAG: glycosyltransferase, partial [Ignavibacteria bacterium]|nr:glycosyltransferase [Ignavibacteria bacterium]
GVFGGASRSLLEMIKAFPKGEVEPVVLLPKGTAMDAFKKNQIQVISCFGLSQFDNNQYSYYRGLRWLVLLRELFYLPFTIASIWKLSNRLKDKIDLIHVNEITNLPSLLLAKFFIRKPIVLHVSSLPRNTNGFRKRMVSGLVSRNAKGIIAIDRTVQNSLMPLIQSDVIHNGFNYKDKYEIDIQIDPNINSSSFKVAMVGNLLYMKGVMEFAQAAKLSHGEGLNISFQIYGAQPLGKSFVNKLKSAIGVNQDATHSITKFIEENALNEVLDLIPFNDDLSEIYPQIDVLCFPSHLNAVGRPVFEAAYYGKPSIVAIKNPMDDTIIDGHTGIVIREKSPLQLFEAIKRLYMNREELMMLGINAKKLTEVH